MIVRILALILIVGGTLGALIGWSVARWLDRRREREEWRRRSVISDVVSHRILGKGADGYHEALGHLTGARS